VSPGPHPGAENALRLARASYLAGEAVSLGGMAAALGVNRATLHRWVGSKDALLAEVMWRLTERTLEDLWDALRSRPGPRVPSLLADYLRATMTQPGARRFALEQNSRLMRLLTTSEHGFHPRLVAAVRGYLAEDLAEHRATTTLRLDELSYACVRIAESYYYLPTISGLQPDPDSAERVLHALVSSPG